MGGSTPQPPVNSNPALTHQSEATSPLLLITIESTRKLCKHDFMFSLFTSVYITVIVFPFFKFCNTIIFKNVNGSVRNICYIRHSIVVEQSKVYSEFLRNLRLCCMFSYGIWMSGLHIKDNYSFVGAIRNKKLPPSSIQT